MKQIKKQLLKAAVMCLVMVGITAISARAGAEEGDFVINNGILESYSGSDKEVIIQENVEEIGKKAFHKNKTIQKVTISSNVKKIGNYAFSECALKEVVIMKGTREIGRESFSGCRKLTKITIPGSVEKIGSSAFSDCAIKKLVIPEGVTTMDKWALSGLGKLQSIKLPRSLKKIPKNAFEADTSLKKVVIPKGCTTIGDRAFWYCPKLKEVIIPEGVKKIGEGAFKDTAVKKITIAKSVSVLGNKYGVFTFSETPQSITEITILNPGLKVKNIFGGIPLQKPVTIKGYKNSTADKFASYINKNQAKFKKPAKFVAL